MERYNGRNLKTSFGLVISIWCCTGRCWSVLRVGDPRGHVGLICTSISKSMVSLSLTRLVELTYSDQGELTNDRPTMDKGSRGTMLSQCRRRQKNKELAFEPYQTHCFFVPRVETERRSNIAASRERQQVNKGSICPDGFLLNKGIREQESTGAQGGNAAA